MLYENNPLQLGQRRHLRGKQFDLALASGLFLIYEFGKEFGCLNQYVEALEIAREYHSDPVTIVTMRLAKGGQRATLIFELSEKFLSRLLNIGNFAHVLTFLFAVRLGKDISIIEQYPIPNNG